MDISCCTCAKLLSALPRHAKGPTSEQSEKPPAPLPESRRLDCCGRTICGSCIHNNKRFAHYCPYCQISTGPSSLPPTGLKDPPSYGFVTAAASRIPVEQQPPPPYSQAAETPRTPPSEKGKKTSAEATINDDSPILHFLDHEHDSVSSLSLRYNVPASALRRANRLGSDHLLLGRRVVLIPAVAGGGAATTRTSLSPHPVGGEDEERRKGRIRRWMVACKEADYDIAVLYLEQSDYDMDAAIKAYFADEAWEKAHPVAGRSSKRGTGGLNRFNTPAATASSSSSSSAIPASSSPAWPLASFGLGSWR